MLTRGTLALLLLLPLTSCEQPATSSTAAPAPYDAPDADTGVTVAQNAGATLVILSLDPAGPGENAVQVVLRDPGGRAVPGAVSVALVLDGSATTAVALAGGDRRGTLVVPRAGRAVLAVQIVDGPSAGGSVTFELDLPVEPPPGGTLERVDRAMNALRTFRETQTLTSGAFTYVSHYDYQAPDRVRYDYLTPEGRPHETRIVGARRFDREGPGSWTESDLGVSSAVPNFGYASRPHRVRIIGREHADGQETFVLALVERGSLDLHYRLWIGPDLLVRRYVMMALGHYMSGTYTDVNAPLEVAPP